MTATFSQVEIHTAPIGRQCLHCGRPATVTALRVGDRHRLPVEFCVEHAAIAGAIDIEIPPTIDDRPECDGQMTLTPPRETP